MAGNNLDANRLPPAEVHQILHLGWIYSRGCSKLGIRQCLADYQSPQAAYSAFSSLSMSSNNSLPVTL